MATGKSILLQLGATIALALGAGAQAQDYHTYLTVQHPEKFTARWEPFYAKADADTKAAREELPHKLDLAYGAAPKQKLDLYFPVKAPKNAPVLLFLHGGGFVEGDRANYGFIAPAFAKHGVIVAVASYRLVGNGGSSYADGAEDAEHAAAWLHANIRRYGGNPNAIVIAGHSAGAIIAADIGTDTAWMKRAGLPRAAIRAVVPISGSYDFTPDDHSRDNIMPTPELKRAASALHHVTSPVARVVVAVGAEESKILKPSDDFYQALKAKGVTAELLVLPGADHQLAVRALGEESSPLFRKTLAALGR